MTDQYRAMVYAGVAIIHFYRKDVVPFVQGETLGEFAKKNDVVMKRVFEEVLATFKYELSHHQIGLIVSSYTAESNSVHGTTPYNPSHEPDIRLVRLA